MGCQCTRFDKSMEIDESVSIGDILRSHIEEYPILLYSKVYCDDSAKAKQLLKQQKIQFEYFEIDNMHEESIISYGLQALTGKKHTPYIFINGSYYGGLKELCTAIESGKLFEVLKTSN